MEVYAEHIKIAFGEPGRDFTHIAGLESKGFVLGPILALQWSLPFVPLRKKGKLPGECYSQDYELEYGSDTIQVQKTGIPEGAKVLLIDDLLATGGTLAAGEKLVTQIDGTSVVGSAVLFEIDVLQGRKKVQKPVLSLIHLE